MLNKSESTNPKAIEEIVCIPMDKLKRVPMDNETTGILVNMLFMQGDIDIPEKEKPFLFQLIVKRIEHCFTYTVKEQKLVLFLAMLTESPGNAVLLMWYLQWWCFKNNIKDLTLDLICTRVFPMGFFSNDDLSKIWDAQKVDREGSGSDNLVDYNAAGNSIHFQS